MSIQGEKATSTACPPNIDSEIWRTRLVSGGGTGLVRLLPCGTRVQKVVLPFLKGYRRSLSIKETRREIVAASGISLRPYQAQAAGTRIECAI